MTLNKIILAVPAAFLLHACSSDSDHDFQTGIDEQAAVVAANAPSQAVFDPGAASPAIPFPSTLLYSGSEDATINIPVEDATNLSDPSVVLNQLDGFSPISPILTPMNSQLNPETVIVGSSVVVVEVEASVANSFATTGVIGPVGPDAIAAIPTPDNLILQPLQPLRPNSTYLVLLTNDLQDTEGNALVRSLTYNLLAGETDLTVSPLDGLQQLTRSHLAVAAGVGLEPDNVVLSWTFNTQSIRDVLQTVKDSTVAQSFAAVKVPGATTTTFNSAAQGKADIWIGTLDVPYYQTGLGDDGADAVLDNFWTGPEGSFLTAFNPMPVVTGTETIPVLISVPNAESMDGGVMPETGWPVAIFQHGITQDRTNLIAIADAMADAGFAVVAIDMPMHGITSTEVPINAANTQFPNDRERHFEIDIVNNDDALDREPDGIVDPSGEHFYQLTNLANSRDNLRQAVADLFVLSASVGGVQKANPDDPNILFDASRKAFIGHSLGGIAGSVFLSYDDTIQSATLAMPGSGIAQLLLASGSFGEDIVNGLAANGVEQGSASFDQFFLASQTAIDSADPANHMSFLAATGTPIHFIEVIGDQTIPNAVPNAPFSGSTPMAALLGLQPVTATTNGGGIVRFSAGDHGSILSPAASLEATIEMQRQMATFAASAGTLLLVTDSTVIQQ